MTNPTPCNHGVLHDQPTTGDSFLFLIQSVSQCATGRWLPLIETVWQCRHDSSKSTPSKTLISPPHVLPHPLSFPGGGGGGVTWSTQIVLLRLTVLLCG